MLLTLVMLLTFVMFVTLTTPKCSRKSPHQGWKKSQGPMGSQPMEPNPNPTPKPAPPPNPKKETYAGAQIGRYAG